MEKRTGLFYRVVAQYDNSRLELTFRLPRVMAIIQDADPSRWMQYGGMAVVADSTDDRYVKVRITPKRIDLIDESREWGARETLDV